MRLTERTRSSPCGSWQATGPSGRLAVGLGAWPFFPSSSDRRGVLLARAVSQARSLATVSLPCGTVLFPTLTRAVGGTASSETGLLRFSHGRRQYRCWLPTSEKSGHALMSVYLKSPKTQPPTRCKSPQYCRKRAMNGRCRGVEQGCRMIKILCVKKNGSVAPLLAEFGNSCATVFGIKTTLALSVLL